jgi:hypothetical protein
VAFAHQHDLHPKTLRFVGEHMPHTATGHLVQSLVSRMSMVGVLANIADVANDDRLHSLLMQRGDKFSGELVQCIV